MKVVLYCAILVLALSGLTVAHNEEDRDFTNEFTNEWVVGVEGGDDVADLVAQVHGVRIKRKVSDASFDPKISPVVRG